MSTKSTDSTTTTTIDNILTKMMKKRKRGKKRVLLITKKDSTKPKSKIQQLVQWLQEMGGYKVMNRSEKITKMQTSFFKGRIALLSL